jgi:hypothetical protein
MHVCVCVSVPSGPQAPVVAETSTERGVYMVCVRKKVETKQQKVKALLGVEPSLRESEPRVITT